MINLEDRPSVLFHKGDRVKLVDDRGIASSRKLRGFVCGEEFIVQTCWSRSRRWKSPKIMCILEGYSDWVFSTRRFELVSTNCFDENLFII